MNMKCTGYVEVDYFVELPKNRMCHCPVCAGFIKWVDHQPFCNKCKTPLIALPDHDEDTGEKLESGRICPIPKADSLHSTNKKEK